MRSRRGEQFGCDDFDLAAINSLGTEVASVNTLSAEAFLRWLPALRGHPRISFGKSTPARVLAEVYRPKILLRKEARRPGCVGADSRENETAIACRDRCLAPARRKISSKLAIIFRSRLTSVWREPLRLTGERADEFLALELPIWREIAEVELPAGIDVAHDRGSAAGLPPEA